MSLAKNLALLALAAPFVMQGCTSPPQSVGASYVPPAQYQGYNCYQLAVEFQRNQTRSLELGEQLDKKASKDQMLGIFGAVVFFPALFMLGGQSEWETEYATLKGEAEAMQQAAFQKKCTAITMQSPAAGLR